jgi:hypothetical protein
MKKERVKPGNNKEDKVPKQPEKLAGTVKEPGLEYHNPRIHFFSSFEEMNEFDAMEMAQSSPLQNFAQVTSLLIQFYPGILEIPMDKKIYYK